MPLPPVSIHTQRPPKAKARIFTAGRAFVSDTLASDNVNLSPHPQSILHLSSCCYAATLRQDPRLYYDPSHPTHPATDPAFTPLNPSHPPPVGACQ